VGGDRAPDRRESHNLFPVCRLWNAACGRISVGTRLRPISRDGSRLNCGRAERGCQAPARRNRFADQGLWSRRVGWTGRVKRSTTGRSRRFSSCCCRRNLGPSLLRR